jgi:hypothetical protein
VSNPEEEALRLREEGLSYQAIADELGVSKKTAGRLVNGQDWGRGTTSSNGSAPYHHEAADEEPTKGEKVAGWLVGAGFVGAIIWVLRGAGGGA